MTTAKDDRIYLQSILDAIEAIDRHQNSKSDPTTIYDAVIYKLATIGEAASKLSITETS